MERSLTLPPSVLRSHKAIHEALVLKNAADITTIVLRNPPGNEDEAAWRSAETSLLLDREQLLYFVTCAKSMCPDLSIVSVCFTAQLTGGFGFYTFGEDDHNNAPPAFPDDVIVQVSDADCSMMSGFQARAFLENEALDLGIAELTLSFEHPRLALQALSLNLRTLRFVENAPFKPTCDEHFAVPWSEQAFAALSTSTLTHVRLCSFACSMLLSAFSSADPLVDSLPRSLEILALDGFHIDDNFMMALSRLSNLWALELTRCKFNPNCFKAKPLMMSLSILTLSSHDNGPLLGAADWIMSQPDAAQLNVSPFGLTQEEMQALRDDGIIVNLF